MPDQLPQYMDADQLFTLKIPKARMKQISELKVISCIIHTNITAVSCMYILYVVLEYIDI